MLCKARGRFRSPNQGLVKLRVTIPKQGLSLAMGCPSPRRTPEPFHAMEKDLSCKFGYRFFISRHINKLMCMQDTSVTANDFALFRHLFLKMFSAETHKYG